MLSSRNVTHRRRLLCSPQRRRARQEACPCFQHARGTTQRRGINTTMKSRRHRGQASVYESPSFSIVHRLRKTSMWRTAMHARARARRTDSSLTCTVCCKSEDQHEAAQGTLERTSSRSCMAVCALDIAPDAVERDSSLQLKRRVCTKRSTQRELQRAR
jgi:hypothetical protein